VASARIDYEVAAGLAPADFLPSYQLGRLATGSGDLVQGAAHYARALELEHDNPDIHTAIAANLHLQGVRKVAEGSMEGAVEDLQAAERAERRALELDPNLPWAHLNLGATLMELNRMQEESDPDVTAEAMMHYEHGIRAWAEEGGDPRDELYASALANQCDALIQMGDLQRALEYCSQAVEAVPDDAVHHYNLAAVYALSGRREEALLALERDFELGDRDYQYLETDDWFDSLRADPSFQELLERMKAE
jgi:tetratricopeptide (TPR) repeat protein